MATSSVSTYENNGVTKDFHLSSSSDTGNRLSPNTQKCPLCRKLKLIFYCKECVHNELFCRPKPSAKEG